MSHPVKIRLTQNAVDRMVQGLASQRWQPARVNGSCVYYNPTTGARCAVGWLLTIRQALRLGRKGVCTLAKEGAIQTDNLNALAQLQEIHDTARTPEAFRVKVQAWCHDNAFAFNEGPMAYVNAEGQEVDPLDYVHEYRGRYYVAQVDKAAGQLIGPLKHPHGVTQFVCYGVSGLPKAGGYSYQQRSKAVSRVCEEYNFDRIRKVVK